ncbi:DUF3391 domain-containing protein, partial [Pseudoxanthomonas japonensis]
MALKTIPTDTLKAGMYVVKLHGPWLEHPFWRTRFVVDQDDVDTLVASGVAAVDIDTQRGRNEGTSNGPSMIAIEADAAPPCDIASLQAAGSSGPPAREPTGLRDELARAKL